MGAVIVSTTATLVASGIAAYTRIFEAKLSITNLPAAVSQLGVSGSPSEARHLVHVNFCVANHGVRSGNVSSVRVSAVGLPKIPNVDVQDLDSGPVSAFSSRSISATLLFDDDMSTPEKARMKLHVLDINGESIGVFEIDLLRPWKIEKSSDGVTAGTATVSISERFLDACQEASSEPITN
jgi:hypothetical protein